MFFQWPAAKPEPKSTGRRERRRRNAEAASLGGYRNFDGTYNENFQRAIENEPLPQPRNPFGRPVLPQNQAHAPRYKSLGEQLRKNALVKNVVKKGEDDGLADIVGKDGEGNDILVPPGFTAVFDDDMETVIGHMDWKNGIAVPLGQAFPSDEDVRTLLVTNTKPGNGQRIDQLSKDSPVQTALMPRPFPGPIVSTPVPGQPPTTGTPIPQGPGTIPMEQAKEIEKWILDQIPDWEDILPEEDAEGSQRLEWPSAGTIDRPDIRDEGTIVESRDARKGGKKAQDSGKNDPHGDGGRAIEKAKQRERELDEAIKNAPNRKAREKAKKIKQRVNEAAQKEKKGETHGKRTKGK